MSPVSVPRIFEIAGWAPMTEPRFSKVTEEISAFCKFAEISNTSIGVLWKAALLEIPTCSVLTTVACLQSTVYNATKDELLTKFVNDALKLK